MSHPLWVTLNLNFTQFTGMTGFCYTLHCNLINMILSKVVIWVNNYLKAMSQPNCFNSFFKNSARKSLFIESHYVLILIIFTKHSYLLWIIKCKQLLHIVMFNFFKLRGYLNNILLNCELFFFKKQFLTHFLNRNVGTEKYEILTKH